LGSNNEQFEEDAREECEDDVHEHDGEEEYEEAAQTEEEHDAEEHDEAHHMDTHDGRQVDG